MYFWNGRVYNSIKMSLKLFPMDPISIIPATVYLMAWRQAIIFTHDG